MASSGGRPEWTRGDLIVLAGAAASIVAAFLSWYEGWGNAFASGLAPLTTFPFVCALVIAGRMLLGAFTDVAVPTRLGRFSWPQIDFFLAGYGAITGLCFLVMDAQGSSRGAGLYLATVAGVVLLVGVLEQHRERRARSRAS